MLDDTLHWYKDATIYELHIKAYKDANGDGIGDFEGLLQNLDYLQELGVTAIWLLPFYPSPLRDDGYDIADYYNVNPSYGTLDDFQAFVKEAHQRGLKVITELVINHTSSSHPWFERARQAPKGSTERNWYVWTDDPTQYHDVRIIFTDTEKSNWTYDEVAGQYYWHRFFSHQPDLNFDSPVVQEEIFRMLSFWADMGVDGFRLDAIPYLFEREGTNSENLPETHAFLRKIRQYVDEKYPGLLLLAEANMWPEDSASYFGNGDECHMNFHFPIMPRMYLALKTEERYPITDILEQTPAIPPSCQWGMFLRNHDELTLEMVTEEERDFMYRQYAAHPQAKINVGIRRRLAPLLDNDRRRIELMYILLFSMPGTPVMYYGDELGMGDNFYLKDRDGVRTPMQWSPERNGGFSDAPAQQLYLPVIASEEYSPQVVNVEVQRQNPNSLFHWIQRLIATRKKYKAFGRGDISFLYPDNARVLAFVRHYGYETILVLVNLSRNSQPVELGLSDFDGLHPVDIFGGQAFPKISKKPYTFTLEGYGYRWLSLERARIPARTDTLKTIHLTSWAEFEDYRLLTDEILPAYLQKCRWFGGKARTIQQVQVRDSVQFAYRKGKWNHVLLLEVSYTEGFPEIYLLPVTLVPERGTQDLREKHPTAVIARVGATKGGGGLLIDLLYHDIARNELLDFILEARGLDTHVQASQLFVQTTPAFESVDLSAIHSRVLGVEQSNSSLILNDAYFVKLYRKLDPVINPDVEVSQFLTSKTAFPNTPPFMASLHYQVSGTQSYVMGMIQQAVANPQDAWAYVGQVLQAALAKGSKKEASKKDIADTLEKNILEISPAFESHIALLGKRTAEMHLALASRPWEAGFEAEEFSLHYQSSLYAGLYSLVRQNFNSLSRQLPKLPAHLKEEAQALEQLKPDILKTFKRITTHKINTRKIRIHGDYHLGQVLFTGNDFLIIDFEGEPARPFSERRLKRSPLKDVAGMLRSFHYAAYAALLQPARLNPEELAALQPQAEEWYRRMYTLLLESYLEVAGKESFIPQEAADRQVLLETFILEKAIYELNYELIYRPDWVMIPINGIKAIMQAQNKD